MSWLLDAWEYLAAWWPLLLTLADFVLVAVMIAWALMIKPDATSAVAWCLLIIFLPFLGAFLFVVFGYQHVDRPLKRKRLHKQRYRTPPHPVDYQDAHHMELSVRKVGSNLAELTTAESIAQLASRLGASTVTTGNQIDFFDDGPTAIACMIEAIEAARHHIHLACFIWEPDELGCRMLDVLAAKARQGVEVRILYDAIGSFRLPMRLLKPLHDAGGCSASFLPVNPLRRRIQVNMRNHRKIMVADGEVGFIGGLNVGDEYLGRNRLLGFWRDTHLRIRGPAVCDLQRVFCEDWDFAADEHLSDQGETDGRYFRAKSAGGPYAVQVIDSGPDDDLKAIREVVFAGIVKARQRLWIASPYFVPDKGLLDALRLAALSGVDVRLLGQLYPDRWVPYYAARYLWTDMLEAGARVYQYAKGMMHAKVILIDDDLVSVGSANLDNRSMFLNFEANCLIYSQEAAARIEESFRRDFENSILLERDVYAARPFSGRLLENACRLASPIL